MKTKDVRVAIAGTRAAEVLPADPRSIDHGLLKSLARSTRNGFGTDISDESVKEHVMGSNILQLLKVEGAPVGFASYDMIEVTPGNGVGRERQLSVLYLRGIVVEKEHQGRGFFKEALSQAIGQNSPDVLSMRTQNPLIYMATKRLVGRMYPNGGVYPSVTLGHNEHAHSLGLEIAKRLGMRRYEDSEFREQRTYETALNDTVPRVDEETERLFSSLRINRNRGDSIVIVSLLRPG